MGIVDVANLKKSYGEIVAVDDISFSIEKGEIFGFLGPNEQEKLQPINMMMVCPDLPAAKLLLTGLMR